MTEPTELDVKTLPPLPDGRSPRNTRRDQIARLLEKVIAERDLPEGTWMPTGRKLANHLGVDAKTTDAAYQTLIDRGIVRANGKRGRQVAGKKPTERKNNQ